MRIPSNPLHVHRNPMVGNTPWAGQKSAQACNDKQKCRSSQEQFFPGRSGWNFLPIANVSPYSFHEALRGAITEWHSPRNSGIVSPDIFPRGDRTHLCFFTEESAT
jgi:hypothetical protein